LELEKKRKRGDDYIMKELDIKVVRTLEGIAQSYVTASAQSKCEIERMAYTIIGIVSRDEPVGYKETCCKLFMGYIRLYTLDKTLTRN
jgi:hypothetical protein